MLNERGRRRAASLSLQNFLAATEIATLFLDRDQRILRFTPRVTGLFHVRMNEPGGVLFVIRPSGWDLSTSMRIRKAPEADRVYG
jgi:hypothetical protein